MFTSPPSNPSSFRRYLPAFTVNVLQHSKPSLFPCQPSSSRAHPSFRKSPPALSSPLPLPRHTSHSFRTLLQQPRSRITPHSPAMKSLLLFVSLATVTLAVVATLPQGTIRARDYTLKVRSCVNHARSGLLIFLQYSTTTCERSLELGERGEESQLITPPSPPPSGRRCEHDRLLHRLGHSVFELHQHPGRDDGRRLCVLPSRS